MSTLTLLVVSTVALLVGFAALYLLARRLENYGIVDVAWSYAFAPVAAFYALAAPGDPVRRALLAALVIPWSLRLGTHLARRVASHHPVEDARYGQLRRDWAGNFAPKMFGFFQLQAVSVVLLALPFLLTARNPAPGLHWLEFAGAALWLAALAGESIADAQLAAFKREPAHRGRVCDVGLWRWSRHPNYFFEWLVWVGFAVFAAASPLGWLGLVSPALILWLLLRVTGIPLTEEQLLRSRGDAYRRYQRTTSPFVPWFPRSEPGSGSPKSDPPRGSA
jgi:steroid 5-alpha reductase family enzyme